MRRPGWMLFVAGMILLISCRTSSFPIAQEAAGERIFRAADGSEIHYPARYEVLDVRDPDRMRKAEVSLPEPARSLLSGSVDRLIFAARWEGRLLMALAREAILGEIPEAERAEWQAREEALQRQVFEMVADTLRSGAPDVELTVGGMTWGKRRDALGVLEVSFTYRQKSNRQDGWLAVVYFPNRIYEVWGVGDEAGFRLLLESSRFTPEAAGGR